MSTGVDFGPECALAARLVALLAWEADRVASRSDRLEKAQIIKDEIAAEQQWFAAAPELDARALRDAALSQTAYLDAARATLERLGTTLSDGQRNAVLVEVATSIRYPKSGISWAIIREEALAEQLVLLDGRMTVEAVKRVVKAHRKARSRLQRQALSPVMKGAFAVGSVTVGVVGASFGVPGVGEAIGTTVLGLHGAAATSAGLAMLGGGSLAAGGFGMAGGILVVKTVAATAYTGAKSLGVYIAGKSRAVFVNELAKLDVLASLTGDEEMRAELLRALRGMLDELDEEGRPVSEDRRSAQQEWFRDPGSWRSGKAAVTQAKAASEIEGSIRALRAEIGHLEGRFRAAEWSRWVPWGSASDLGGWLDLDPVNRA